LGLAGSGAAVVCMAPSAWRPFALLLLGALIGASTPSLRRLTLLRTPTFPRVVRTPAHPTVRACSERWFEQPVSHYDATPTPGAKPTWMQRYFVCRADLLARRGAPILFYCGNEANVELYVNATGLLWEHADALGAGLVFAEHRFFGRSLPCAPDEIPKRLGWLSSEQALADYARLLRALRADGGRQRPAVAFGGSYGGMLASWLRMKYPSAVDGAIAASAPILSFLGLSPAYDMGSFAKLVTFDASANGGGSEACVERVRAAWKLVLALGTSTAGRARLDAIFRLCPSSRLASESDALVLAGWLQSAMDFMAMGSFPYASSYMLNGDGSLPPFPLREMCRRIEEASEPAAGSGGAPQPGMLLAALREGVGIFYNYTGSPAGARGCFDLGVTGNDETTADGQRWDWLYCSDLLQPAARDGVNDMFYPQPFDLAAVAAGCRERWHVEPRPEWPVTNYGGWAALRAASNIVFTNGELDPWRGGGVTVNVSSTVRSYVIPGVGHHVDLFFSHAADTEPLRAVRAAQIAAVRSWIADAAAAIAST
jgi:lysosomal Pro-X carboxypeptidase